MKWLKKWFEQLKKKEGEEDPNTQPPPADDDVNYFQDSLPIADDFGIGMVPREHAAFEDFRWDLITVQGLGPETILVHNCRELSLGGTT